jgi:hypothetical protein
MPGEDSPGQVIEARPTGPTLIALTVGLRLILAILDDLLGVAMRTGDPIRPAEVSDGLEALGVVDALREVDHGAHLRLRAMKSRRERSQRPREIELEGSWVV